MNNSMRHEHCGFIMMGQDTVILENRDTVILENRDTVTLEEREQNSKVGVVIESDNRHFQQISGTFPHIQGCDKLMYILAHNTPNTVAWHGIHTQWKSK